MKEPFFTTLFTVSSHDPYKVPDQYKQKFPEGTMKMHQVVAYSDYSLKKFFEKASTSPLIIDFKGATVPGTPYPTITPGLLCLIGRKICMDTPMTPPEEQLATFKGKNGESLPEMQRLNLDRLEATENEIADLQQEIRGYREVPSPRPPEDVYKAAPRDGVWATPPFMHNGSVPNLYEMLIPAAERTRKFYLGGDFDPVKVGLAALPGVELWRVAMKPGRPQAFGAPRMELEPEPAPVLLLLAVGLALMFTLKGDMTAPGSRAAAA
jgi:hypothetical protein